MKSSVGLSCALVFSLLPLSHSARAAPPADKPMEQLAIYEAKGAPDSCGPGCDHWIAIEGKVDPGSATRVERFLHERKDTHRPIYFNSPGGEMRDALAIGRLLRAQKAVGRVGRTVVDACPGTQTDDACTLIKTNRDEVIASIVTRGAVCGSACTFLLFGTSTREVAPDSMVAVHGARVGMQFRVNVTEARREEAIAKAHVEADRMAFAYVDEMGISRDVMTLADSISPDNIRVLTRQELYNFRIDTRNVVETPWAMEKAPSPLVQKIVQIKTDSGFQKFEWRFICGGKTQTRLMVANELSKDASGTRGMTMVAGSTKAPQFAKLPIRVGPYEIWTAVITADAMKDLVAVPRLRTDQSTLLPDGKTTSTFFEIETRGLEPASDQLSAACQTVQAKIVPPKLPSPEPSSPWPSSSKWTGSPKWPAPPPVTAQGIGVVGARDPAPQPASAK
ncbi:hypothetical protein [Bradyrhizobium ganzhouense]|uniref:COG3904 family protein n=1 Tax=Bradyrhizobium ganzhouense TaxID=1179767 RepID=UPI003CF4F135